MLQKKPWAERLPVGFVAVGPGGAAGPSVVASKEGPSQAFLLCARFPVGPGGWSCAGGAGVLLTVGGFCSVGVKIKHYQSPCKISSSPLQTARLCLLYTLVPAVLKACGKEMTFSCWEPSFPTPTSRIAPQKRLLYLFIFLKSGLHRITGWVWHEEDVV